MLNWVILSDCRSFSQDRISKILIFYNFILNVWNALQAIFDYFYVRGRVALAQY